MGKGAKKTVGNRENLLRRMSAGSGDCVQKVIRFPNNDVPDYLRNLARFEEESQRTRIEVR